MYSAFGVDHGDVSKAMGPRKVAALKSVAQGGQGRSKTMYARARLALSNESKGIARGTPQKRRAKSSMKNALQQASPYNTQGKLKIPNEKRAAALRMREQDKNYRPGWSGDFGSRSRIRELP